ncbi:MAG: PKD domain-containing protein, partial [Thermoplasmata archaeon]
TQTWNISQIFSSSPSGFMFNFTKAPVNFTFTQNNITITKLGANKFYFASLNKTNKAVTIAIPVMKYAHYIMQVYTNTSSTPQITKFNATSNYYTFTWNNWSVDPLVQYSTPQAVISVPSVVAYDSAIVISGANSIASENATITNWTWKITGPQNQSYIKYGKAITQYFSITGVYTITLTVTDSNGLTNTTTTTINVVSASQDLNIKITYTLTVLSTGYYEYDVTVYAQDNVSISQFLASVDSVYVNATFIKQVGYAYYYQVVFNPNSFGYGNHTIKFEAVNTLNGYNTLIVYATFGSVNKGGIIAYIFGHLALTIVILIFIAILISFIYVLYENRLYRKIKHSRRVKVRRR